MARLNLRRFIVLEFGWKKKQKATTKRYSFLYLVHPGWMRKGDVNTANRTKALRTHLIVCVRLSA
jgi:hypothetical protein